MSKRNWIRRGAIAAVLVLRMVSTAHAGSIYVCKGTHGVNSYQTLPCSQPADQLRKTHYSDAMARPAAPMPRYAESRGELRPVAQPMAPTGYTPRRPASEPSGYRCVAGNRTWVQLTPCPATYAHTKVLDADGYTDSGEHVNGSADLNQQLPVQQQPLDQTKLCDQVAAGARIGQGGDDVDQSYEHNKVMRDQCGG